MTVFTFIHALLWCLTTLVNSVQLEEAPVIYSFPVNIIDFDITTELSLRKGQTAKQAVAQFNTDNNIPDEIRSSSDGILTQKLLDAAKAQNVKIIDTITYNGEPIVELRLSLLYDVVDAFFITEASETFSSKPKPGGLYRNIHTSMFDKYIDKIYFVHIEQFPAWGPEQEIHWHREFYQRNAAANMISETFRDDRHIVLVCDADEIPDPELVKLLPLDYSNLKEPVYMNMAFYYFNFKWRVPSGVPWLKAYAISDEGLKNSEYTFNDMRKMSPETHVLPNGNINYTCCYDNAGWHASYMMDIKGIRLKLESFAHIEYDHEPIKQASFLRERIKLGKDLFSHKDLVPYDVMLLPKKMQEFHEDMLFLQEYS